MARPSTTVKPESMPKMLLLLFQASLEPRQFLAVPCGLGPYGLEFLVVWVRD